MCKTWKYDALMFNQPLQDLVSSELWAIFFFWGGGI